MAKLIDRGSAKPTDSIYSSGLEFFVPMQFRSATKAKDFSKFDYPNSPVSFEQVLGNPRCNSGDRTSIGKE